MLTDSRNKLALLALLATVGAPSLARADFITTLSASVTPSGGGTYDYSYNLTNTAQSTIGAYEFALGVDTGANLQSIVAPSGWDETYNPGDTSITWSTFTPLDPGSSAVFAFASLEPPVSGDYVAIGFDPNSFQFYTNTGTSLVPGVASVPEPASFVLLASGFGLIVTWLLVTRQRRNLRRSEEEAGEEEAGQVRYC